MKLTMLFIVPFISTVCCGQQSEISDELATFLTDDVAELVQNEASQEFLTREFSVIDLNKDSLKELNAIPWLSPIQIQSLQNYLKKNGPLVSLYELQAVPGWDLPTIHLTEPFIYITNRDDTYDARKLRTKIGQDGGLEFIVRAKRRLELSKGYSINGNSRFKGSPNYWFYRIRYRDKGLISFGITGEKDPGEQFRWNQQSRQFGPDYMSMHLLIENKGALKRLLIGDFRAQWDQGLILSNSFSLGSQVITGPRKVHTGLVAHSGSQEYGFFRGAGIEFEFLNLSLSAFYSRQQIDAQILAGDSLKSLPQRISSILETGLHRTTVELERKNSVSDQVTGLHLSKQWSDNLTVALSAIYRDLKVPLIPAINSYNGDWFNGKRNINYSGSVEYLWKNINFFGQIAMSSNKGWGALTGIIASLSHKSSLSLHFRNFTRNFHSIAGNAFGVSSRSQNEQGIYWGLQITPNKRWVSGIFFNIYKFPNPSFKADGASHGLDHLIRIQYFPTRSTYLNLFWKSRTRMENTQLSPNKLTHDLAPVTKHTIGIRTKWANEANLSLFTNIQYSKQLKNYKYTEGLIVSSRVNYEIKLLKFTISGALFNTDNFDNRQYIYEQGLPYSLAIPFYDGSGLRWYLLIRLKIIRNLGFWFRFARTSYFNKTELGNGVDTISGRKRTDLSFQVRYSL